MLIVMLFRHGVLWENYTGSEWSTKHNCWYTFREFYLLGWLYARVGVKEKEK